MSINKFIIPFVKNKPFFRVVKIERHGFWIFELLVSIVILMAITLVLLRFTCNMIALQADSVNRLRVIDYVSSGLDVNLGASDNAKSFDALNIPGFGKNTDINKEGVKDRIVLKYNFCQINIVKSNLPESIKNGQKSGSFRVLDISVSFKSAFGSVGESGRENVVKIFASAVDFGSGGVT